MQRVCTFSNLTMNTGWEMCYYIPFVCFLGRKYKGQNSSHKGQNSSHIEIVWLDTWVYVEKVSSPMRGNCTFLQLAAITFLHVHYTGCPQKNATLRGIIIP